MKNNTGYIIGAYPCAPSFHQKSEEEETEFWRQLSGYSGYPGAGAALS